MPHTLDDPEQHDPTTPSDASRALRDRSSAVSAPESGRGAVHGPPRQQWREEFPYHWSADELVTRRDTLRFLVAGTGALFVATAALAIVGTLGGASQAQIVAVAREGELAANESRVFTFPDQYSQGIVVNVPGTGLVAYSDVCTHLSCAVLYQPGERQFFCPCHEGRFDAATGDVLAGPPTRPLPTIELRSQNGIIFAVREVPR
jgi:nitrite reductase/ring-hydroxylating ferredoxin subunit